MYGRARLSTDFSEIRIAFRIPPERPTPNFAPTWNLAPTDPIPIVRRDRDDGQRRLEVVRWGLIPYWAKDVKIAYSTINALRGYRDQAGLPRGLQAAPLPRAARRVLPNGRNSAAKTGSPTRSRSRAAG